MAASPKPPITPVISFTISSNAFDRDISDVALAFSRKRKAEDLFFFRHGGNMDRYLDFEVPSTHSERETDWRNAIAAVAVDGLKGRYALHSLSRDCFHHFEGIWLEDLKKAIAFCHWIDEPADSASDPHDEVLRVRCYFKGCNELRDSLAAHDKPHGHGAVEYLSEAYLDSHHHPDPQKTGKLIAAKSERLSGSVSNPYEIAKRFVNTFYSGVHEAITKATKPEVVQVLRAVQHGGSEPGKPSIINVYEALLLILFLDGKTVRSIWDDSASGITREATL